MSVECQCVQRMLPLPNMEVWTEDMAADGEELLMSECVDEAPSDVQEAWARGLEQARLRAEALLGNCGGEDTGEGFVVFTQIDSSTIPEGQEQILDTMDLPMSELAVPNVICAPALSGSKEKEKECPGLERFIVNPAEDQTLAQEQTGDESGVQSQNQDHDASQVRSPNAISEQILIPTPDREQEQRKAPRSGDSPKIVHSHTSVGSQEAPVNFPALSTIQDMASANISLCTPSREQEQNRASWYIVPPDERQPQTQDLQDQTQTSPKSLDCAKNQADTQPVAQSSVRTEVLEPSHVPTSIQVHQKNLAQAIVPLPVQNSPQTQDNGTAELIPREPRTLVSKRNQTRRYIKAVLHKKNKGQAPILTTKTVPEPKELDLNIPGMGRTYPSLAIIVKPSLRLTEFLQIENIKRRLKLEHYITKLTRNKSKLIEWLIHSRIVPPYQMCDVLSSTSSEQAQLKLAKCHDEAAFPNSAGYIWICENCKPPHIVPVVRGSILESLGGRRRAPLWHLLKFLAQWAGGARAPDEEDDPAVDVAVRRDLCTRLRAICTLALQRRSTLGGPDRRVEIGIVSLGMANSNRTMRIVKVEVLGVLDVSHKKVRLLAIEPLGENVRVSKARFRALLRPLERWVDRRSLLVTDCSVDADALRAMGFARVQQAPPEESGPGAPPHARWNARVMHYLKNTVPLMFQHTLSALTLPLIQQFLDELAWREIWGQNPEMAFCNIVQHIAEERVSFRGTNFVEKLQAVAENPSSEWIDDDIQIVAELTKEQHTAPCQRVSSKRSMTPCHPKPCKQTKFREVNKNSEHTLPILTPTSTALRSIPVSFATESSLPTSPDCQQLSTSSSFQEFSEALSNNLPPQTDNSSLLMNPPQCTPQASSMQASPIAIELYSPSSPPSSLPSISPSLSSSQTQQLKSNSPQSTEMNAMHESESFSSLTLPPQLPSSPLSTCSLSTPLPSSPISNMIPPVSSSNSLLPPVELFTTSASNSSIPSRDAPSLPSPQNPKVCSENISCTVAPLLPIATVLQPLSPQSISTPHLPIPHPPDLQTSNFQSSSIGSPSSSSLAFVSSLSNSSHSIRFSSHPSATPSTISSVPYFLSWSNLSHINPSVSQPPPVLVSDTTSSSAPSTTCPPNDLLVSSVSPLPTSKGQHQRRKKKSTIFTHRKKSHTNAKLVAAATKAIAFATAWAARVKKKVEKEARGAAKVAVKKKAAIPKSAKPTSNNFLGPKRDAGETSAHCSAGKESANLVNGNGTPHMVPCDMRAVFFERLPAVALRCICGYSPPDGDALASHLVTSNHEKTIMHLQQKMSDQLTSYYEL